MDNLSRSNFIYNENKIERSNKTHHQGFYDILASASLFIGLWYPLLNNYDFASDLYWESNFDL